MPLREVGMFQVQALNGVAVPEHAKYGGKAVLPHIALQRLARWEISSPFIFKLQHLKSKSVVFCGVLTFETKNEANPMKLPGWMMRQLKASNGDSVKTFVLQEKVPVGKLAKFQPLNMSFLRVMNPKELLERALTHYTCLTVNDQIDISHLNTVYTFLVTQTDPSPTIAIVDCDLPVDFDPPPGYEEWMAEQRIAAQRIAEQRIAEQREAEERMAEDAPRAPPQINNKSAVRFKELKDIQNDTPNSAHGRGIPDYDYKLGTIKMQRRKFVNSRGRPQN